MKVIKAFDGGKRAEEVTGEMCKRIKEVVYEYSGRTTPAAAIGALEIAKREILADADKEG